MAIIKFNSNQIKYKFDSDKNISEYEFRVADEMAALSAIDAFAQGIVEFLIKKGMDASVAKSMVESTVSHSVERM